VLAGIGLHLGSVEGYMTQAHHPRELTQPQNLNEKTFQSIKAAAAKLADGAVVLLLVTGQHPEGQVLIAGTLNLPGGDDAHAVEAAPTFSGRIPSPHSDLWPGRGSGSGRDLAHPPDPAGNKPGGLLRATRGDDSSRVVCSLYQGRKVLRFCMIDYLA
jgi:hypothetical protein